MSCFCSCRTLVFYLSLSWALTCNPHNCIFQLHVTNLSHLKYNFSFLQILFPLIHLLISFSVSAFFLLLINLGLTKTLKSKEFRWSSLFLTGHESVAFFPSFPPKSVPSLLSHRPPMWFFSVLVWVTDLTPLHLLLSPPSLFGLAGNYLCVCCFLHLWRNKLKLWFQIFVSKLYGLEDLLELKSTHYSDTNMILGLYPEIGSDC